jgi:hypothetical protein
MYGAGGTPGGAGRFFLGLLLLVAGTYLFLSHVQVTNSFSLSHGLFYVSGFRVTSGFMLVPFMIGVGMLFFNFRNLAGWVLMFGSLAAIVLGIIASLDFYLSSLSALDLLIIMAMMAGGIGLFISSFRNYPKP